LRTGLEVPNGLGHQLLLVPDAQVHHRVRRQLLLGIDAEPLHRVGHELLLRVGPHVVDRRAHDLLLAGRGQRPDGLVRARHALLGLTHGRPAPHRLRSPRARRP